MPSDVTKYEAWEETINGRDLVVTDAPGGVGLALATDYDDMVDKRDGAMEQFVNEWEFRHRKR